MLVSLIFTLFAVAAVSGHSAPELESRQGGPLAKVYDKCVNSNHVALTFVRLKITSFFFFNNVAYLG
jgi:hypothetical protein